jgi:chemosensory pili system protein ChpA (sensor histidine kinase/response regulator)
MTADKIDRDLLPVFLEEGKELLAQIDTCLKRCAQHGTDAETLSLLRCAVHTIKGSARMVGAMGFGAHWHQFEAMIENVFASFPIANTAQTTRAESNLIQPCFAHYEQAVKMFDALALSIRTEDAGDIKRLSQSASGAHRSDKKYTRPVKSPVYLRLRSQVLDQLLNDADEIAIAGTQVDNNIHRLQSLIKDIGNGIERVNQYARDIHVQSALPMHDASGTHPAQDMFDALEMERFTQLQEMFCLLSESVGDITSLHKSLVHVAGDIGDMTARRSRMTRALQNKIMEARMVPVKSMQDRLQRVIRQAGTDAGKEVMLEIKGLEQEIDRSVLERLTIVLEHVLRNAVAHGIEHRLVRLEQGKSAQGHVVIALTVNGNTLSVSVHDDGQGVDLARLKAQAVRCGLLKDHDEINAHNLLTCMTHSGLSTSEHVTQSAGRGIGMDVVHSEILALGGQLDVNTKVGKGTTFVIDLPLKLAVTAVVLVRQADASYAIPSLYVERVLTQTEVVQHRLSDGSTYDWLGQTIPVVSLARLVGVSKHNKCNRHMQPGSDQSDCDHASKITGHAGTALVLRHGKQHIVVLVDAVQGTKDVVTKPLCPSLSRVRGLLGATILGTGEVALIVHPARMMSDRSMVPDVVQSTHAATASRDASTQAPDHKKNHSLAQIMVVDDSLTVRSFMAKLLTREGYAVLLAKDGMEAMLHLQQQRPDIAVIDVEMPRMHGFSLLEKIRTDTKTANLPVVMVTSRTAKKHRDKANALGVNAYLGKPCQEEALLAVIAALTASHDCPEDITRR